MLSRRHLISIPSLHPRSAHPHPNLFHSSAAWKAEAADYYGTLGLDSNASAGAIKKQFYNLSKTHHPDHNPNDPQASERFVKISEAYAVLGNLQRRERYDRDVRRAQGTPQSQARRGSHSSSSTPFGSRPASGLSRRRTQFRGPPPSFYRSGGWGKQGAKRQSQADAAASSNGADSAGGGSGPGQRQGDFGNDVPHFDREGHSRTQEQQDQRRRRRLQKEDTGYSEGGSVLVKFVLISAVVSVAFSIPSWFDSAMSKRKRRDETSKRFVFAS